MARTTEDIKIRCVQLAPEIAALEANLRRIEEEIRQAADDSIDLLVLPELSTSGYALTSAEARETALTAYSPVLSRWAELLGEDLTVVIGFAESADGLVYNSAAILVPGKPVSVYRKLHLWDTEKLIFTPGSDAPPVVETPFGRLGVVICYDLEFPEVPRSLALRGADVIAVPTNWPLLDRPAGEYAPEVVQAMAAARATRVCIACCDRSGEERGIEWTRGSAIIEPEGWPVGQVDAAGRLDAAIRLTPDRRRLSDRNDLFGDRRPEFYGSVASITE